MNPRTITLLLCLLALWLAPARARAQTQSLSQTEVLIAGKRYLLEVTLRPLVEASIAGTINAPTHLTSYAATKDSITLIWRDRSHNEHAFNIFRRVDKGEWARVGIVGPNVTTFTDTGLTPNTEYFYRLRANNNLLTSDWSDTVSIWTWLLPPPVNTDPKIVGFVGADGKSVSVAAAGQELTIVGENFGAGGSVTYNSQKVTVVDWQATTIKIKLDGFINQLNPGVLLVWRSDGKYDSTLAFRIGLP